MSTYKLIYESKSPFTTSELQLYLNYWFFGQFVLMSSLQRALTSKISSTLSPDSNHSNWIWIESLQHVLVKKMPNAPTLIAAKDVFSSCREVLDKAVLLKMNFRKHLPRFIKHLYICRRTTAALIPVQTLLACGKTRRPMNRVDAPLHHKRTPRWNGSWSDLSLAITTQMGIYKHFKCQRPGHSAAPPPPPPPPGSNARRIHCDANPVSSSQTLK